MAVQVGDIAHLVMTDGGVTPTGVNTAGKTWAVTPEAVGLWVASTGMGVRFAENDFLRGGGHLLDRIGYTTAHDIPVGAVGTVVVPVGPGRCGRAEERLRVKIAAGAGTRIARPSFEIRVSDLHHDFVPERMLEGGAVGPFVARSTIVCRRQIAFVVTRVHIGTCAQLLHVADAVDGVGLVAGFGEGGQKHGGQNRDDGDDDQQLNQREMTVFLHFSFSPVIDGFA